MRIIRMRHLNLKTKDFAEAKEIGFKKGEILSTYNELMLYIKTYASDIIQDDSFKSQIFNSSYPFRSTSKVKSLK